MYVNVCILSRMCIYVCVNLCIYKFIYIYELMCMHFYLTKDLYLELNKMTKTYHKKLSKGLNTLKKIYKWQLSTSKNA